MHNMHVQHAAVCAGAVCVLCVIYVHGRSCCSCAMRPPMPIAIKFKGRQKKNPTLTWVGGWVISLRISLNRIFLGFAYMSHHRALKSTHACVVWCSIPSNSNVQTYVKIIAIRPVSFRSKMQKSSVRHSPSCANHTIFSRRWLQLESTVPIIVGW